MSKAYRCDECGKYRVGVTVVDGRDLCPKCVPPLPPSANTNRTRNPLHRDPLFRELTIADAFTPPDLLSRKAS